MRKALTLTLLLAGAIFTANSAAADEFKAKVLAVTDGDSMLVLHDNVKEKVILYGVDCPENEQDYGSQARQFTDQCCYGKTVSIDDRGRDKNGRTIAVLYLPDGTDLNQELVRQGLAWWSDKYAPGDMNLKKYHYAAKAAKLGLWSHPNPIPPWVFRNGKKDVHAEIKAAH